MVEQHFFGPGPKRILAIDGGGIRGAISLAFLARIEHLLKKKLGPEVRLSDYFDMIGGTSSGAILASGLSLGLSLDNLKDFFLRLAPTVFHRSIWRLVGFQSKFDARRLQAELETAMGSISIDSDKIKTGICVILKRMDTGSAWIVSNNPRSRYWNDPPDGSYVGNRRYKLAMLVRGSAAAPHYFDPQLLQISENEEPGLFVDGALTPYNNPSLLLLLMTALPQYGIGWPLGPDKLRIVSIGAGRHRDVMSTREGSRMSAVGVAIRSLTGMISECDTLSLGMMQALGTTVTPWTINSEAGTMAGLLPGGPLFDLLRYDILLESNWLQRELDVQLAPKTLAKLRAIDDPGMVKLAYEIGEKAAEKQIKEEHFASAFLNAPASPASPSVEAAAKG